MTTVNVDSSRLDARLEGACQGIPGALAAAAESLGEQFLGAVRSNMPSGPLADAYAVQVQAEGNAVEVALSNSLPYAAFYEFGFQGSEQVSEHLRQMTEAFGKPVATPHEVLVRSYSRQVDAPAHGAVAQAMEGMAPQITDSFTQAVLEELSP